MPLPSALKSPCLARQTYSLPSHKHKHALHPKAENATARHIGGETSEGWRGVQGMVVGQWTNDTPPYT